MLSVRGLHTFYGDSHVLHGVDLDIPAGAAVGLLGRNGMGKTTLIRTVMGYLRPREGSIAWDGRPVTGAAPEVVARLGVGYVPEGRGIFPNLSVRENLVMAARAPADGAPTWTFERVMATFPRLSERLSHVGAEALVEALASLESLVPAPQDDAAATHAPMLKKEHGRVDFTKSAREVRDWIRAMDPWPGAETTLVGQPLRLFSARLVSGGGVPGSVMGADRDGLLIACGEGAVGVAELQLPGKKRMAARALLAGHPIPTGTRLGQP